MRVALVLLPLVIVLVGAVVVSAITEEEAPVNVVVDAAFHSSSVKQQRSFVPRLHPTVVEDPKPLCDAMCTLPITWDDPAYACSLSGDTSENFMCPQTYTKFTCAGTTKLHSVGFKYPGPCGCPNACHNSTAQGLCISGSCACSIGWGGQDCSIPVCGVNRCSGEGMCTSTQGNPVCQCNPGFSSRDCSVKNVAWPPPPQLIPRLPYANDKYGDDHPLFNESMIGQIYIKMSQQDFEFLVNPANRDNDEYKRANFTFFNGIENKTMEDIGFRVKGGITRTFMKKTFKVAFNQFDNKGRKLYKLKKFDLRNLAIDPSATRERLSWAMLRSMGIATVRQGYMSLFINGVYRGLYLATEVIDEQFLKSRYGNSDGALYKCTGFWTDLGNNILMYKLAKRNYDPKTELAESNDGYRLLMKLITTARRTPDETFPTEIQKILDVDHLLRLLAFEIVGGQIDGYINGNNYFLYWKPDIQKWQILRHDMDMSLGWNTEFWPMDTADLYAENYANGWLIGRLMNVPEFKQAYSGCVDTLLSKYVNLQPSGVFIKQMNATRDLIASEILKDQYQKADYAWSFNEFKSSFGFQNISRPTGAIMKNFTVLGLPDYVKRRYGSAMAQLHP